MRITSDLAAIFSKVPCTNTYLILTWVELKSPRINPRLPPAMSNAVPILALLLCGAGKQRRVFTFWLGDVLVCGFKMNI